VGMRKEKKPGELKTSGGEGGGKNSICCGLLREERKRRTSRKKTEKDLWGRKEGSMGTSEGTAQICSVIRPKKCGGIGEEEKRKVREKKRAL